MHKVLAETALVAGATGALVSSLLPSPTTIAKFKPWKDEDPIVRIVFWLSIGTAIALAIFLFGPAFEGRE